MEIAHVLFIDIVGYSKVLIDEQRDLLNELNKIVRETPQFKNAEAAGKLIRLPTGDGMALAFFYQSGSQSADAIGGVQRACDLALVYALTGEIDQALTLIERLVRTPGATTRSSFYDGGITQAELRLRWQWDALRTSPRFQKILEGPEPKTIYN